MNLILTGFACSGKTTFGEKVATHLRIPFIDTDALLENPHQLYSSLGEKAFREKEWGNIKELKTEKSVIALGGGTLLHPEVPSYLKKRGRIVYLAASLDLLWARIEKKGIPAYLDPLSPYVSFCALFEKRAPLYSALADSTLETTHLTDEEIIDRLSNLYGT